MKRTPLDERPDWLPDGWHMLFRPRKDGKTDRYFMSPSTGHKCFSKSQVMDRIAIEMDDEDDTQIGEQPDGQPTRTRSGRAIRRPSKDIRRRHQPTVEIGDSPEWLPSGWILEIRTSQGPGGMKYKRYVDTSTDSSFSSKKAVLRYLQSEGLGSPLPTKERSTSTNSAADIHTSSNQSGSIDSAPANNVGPLSPLDIEPCSSKKSTKAVWSTKNENIFIDILIEYVNMGSLTKSAFTTEICNMIFTEFIKRTNKSYDRSQIRIKYFGLKKRYKNFKRLIEHGGFCWDSSTNNVTANKEVWDEYVKANPWAKSFKTNGCPEYSRLCTIFGDATPTGKDGQGTSGVLSNHVDSTPDHDDSLSETEFSLSPTSENGAQSTQTRPSAGRRRKSRSLLDLTMVDSAMSPFSKVAKKTPEASPSASNQFTPIAGRRRKSGSMVASVPEAILEDVPGFTKVAKKTPTASPSTSTPGSGNPFSMTNCMLELKKIKDISMPVQLKAVSALTVEVWREAFMNMDEGLKKAWLRSLEPDLRSSKTGLICHDEGICTPSATKVVFNETENPSPGKTLDLPNETMPDSRGRKRGRGRKNTGTEEQVDSPKQASATQSQPRKTVSSKAITVAVAVRSSERLSGIKTNEQVDTQKQGSAVTSSEQQARTKADHVDDSEISELPCQTTDSKQEQLSVEGSRELSSGARSDENQKQGSAAKFLPRRTKSSKASAPPSRSSKRLVGIKAVHDVEITDRPRETMVCNSEQLPVLGSGQSFGKSDEPEAAPTVDIDYFLGKIEAEKPPVAGETKLSCDMSGSSLTPQSPELLVEIKAVNAVDPGISDTLVSKSEQLPLASELGSIQSCTKSDDREAAPAVDIGFIEKLPVNGETQLNGGWLVDMEAVHAVDSGICDHPRETMVSKPEQLTAVPALGSVRSYDKTDEPEVGDRADLPLTEKPPMVGVTELCGNRPHSTLVLSRSPKAVHAVDSGITDRPAERMVSMSVDSRIHDRPAETTMVSMSVDSGITNRSAETMASMSVDSGITNRSAETMVSMSDELQSPKTGHAVDSRISGRPAESMVSMSVDFGIIDRPAETMVSLSDEPRSPKTGHAVDSMISHTETMVSMFVDSGITDRPAETMVSMTDQPWSPKTVHAVNSGISDRLAETMVRMSVESRIHDRPTETMVSMSDEPWHPKTRISDQPAETMASMSVDSGITDRPTETMVDMSDQPWSPKTVHAVNSGISDRPAETMVSMFVNSVITDLPAETMIGTSDRLPVIPVPDESEAATSEVDERKLSTDSCDSLLNKPFGASWPDPCIEFAFKTLTTDMVAVAVDNVLPETLRQDSVSPETLCKVSFSPEEISVLEEVPTIWGAGCSAEGKATRNGESRITGG